MTPQENVDEDDYKTKWYLSENYHASLRRTIKLFEKIKVKDEQGNPNFKSQEALNDYIKVMHLLLDNMESSRKLINMVGNLPESE